MDALKLAVSLLLSLALLAGCSPTAHITTRQSYSGEKLARPNRIIITDFAATAADVPPESPIAGQSTQHPAPQTPEQIATGRKLGAQVAQELAADIRAMGLPAERAAGRPAPGIGDLVIRGYFISVDPGSADQRVMVGFGEGAANLKTMVEGYLMTKRGLRLLGRSQLESGASKTPGVLMGVTALAVTGSPIGLIVGGASKLKGEQEGTATLEGAAKQTAQEIAGQLRVKFQEQGWI